MQDSTYSPRPREQRLPADVPNILVVLIDDAGPALPAPLGGEVATPAFARILRAGVGFNRLHTTASGVGHQLDDPMAEVTFYDTVEARFVGGAAAGKEHEMARDGRGVLAGIGIGVAMVLCCAAPALVAGGALAAIGGFLGDPLVIAVGIVGVAVAVPLVRRGHAARGGCREGERARTPTRTGGRS